MLAFRAGNRHRRFPGGELAVRILVAAVERSALLGALFGKSRASIGRAGSRVLKERGDVGRAKVRVEKVEDDLKELEEELEDKIDDLVDDYDIDNVDIEEFQIKPRKTDIQINDIAVVWRTI